MSQNPNALREQGSSVLDDNYTTKRFPPYGRQLNDMRHAGFIPDNRIIVTTDWSLGAAYPRIVITGDIPIVKLNFYYLSGLSVQIVYHENETKIISDLVDEILKDKPKALMTFNYDTAKKKDFKSPATRLIYCDSTEAHRAI